MEEFKMYDIGLAVKHLSEEQLNMYQEETVWTAVSTLAQQLGFGKESDEFVALYRNIQGEYDYLKQHHCYLQYMALQTLRQLIATNRLAMYIPTDGDIGDVVEGIQHMASIIMNTFMWLHAASFLVWVDNDTWATMPPEEQLVTFPLTLPTSMAQTQEPTND
jgi:hypothetical protein